MKLLLKTAITAATVLFTVVPAHAEKIGDLTTLKGVRDNTIQGFGLVTGLPNSGDRNRFATENLTTLIQHYGIKVPDNVSLRSRNVAAVMINSTLPPFAKEGQRIDVTVSSIGDAKSLRGGTLIAAPLRGLNGETYAIAQGQVLVDGISATGLDGSSIEVNVSSVGRIPAGATVERELDYTEVFNTEDIILNMNHSEFAMAHTIQEAINEAFGSGTARATDAGSVSVIAPQRNEDRVEFITLVNDIDVTLPEPPARVTINSRTGTVLFTQNVTIAPVAITYRDIIVNISEDLEVSQGAPLGGRTVVTSNSQISIENGQGEMELLESANTLADLVAAMNDIGVNEKDMVSILQLLKESGALRARLIVL